MKQTRVKSHYVYLYRDLRQKPRYVGYGKTSGRAVKHLSLSHNDNLNAFLESQQFSLEIAGPFENEEMARGVETALISALRPDCNIDPGQRRWRFRPLGVPEGFAERLSLPSLTREDFLEHNESFLFVKISDKNFEDQEGIIRPGYNPDSPPSDRQILNRMDKWWQLGSHIEEWRNSGGNNPIALIGINGRPGGQIIVGSVLIDRYHWEKALCDGGLYSVPTIETPKLDALALRGRRIDRKAKIKFGAFSSQLFLLLNPDGTTIGGNPDRISEEDL